MKAFSFLLIGIFAGFLSFAQDRPNDSVPPSEGVFYRSVKGWQQVRQLSMTGRGLKHVGKMLVPGLTPQMVWTFRGAEAPIQIDDRRPTFYVRELETLENIAGWSVRDLVIVRFDTKKDRRELQITTGGNMFTFKSGFSKERVPDISATKIADGIFAVTPIENLKPGEYMLTFTALGASGSGYDFGIK